MASTCAVAFPAAAAAQDRPGFLAPTDDIAGAVELSVDGSSVGLVEALVAEDGEPYLPVAVVAGLAGHRVLSESREVVEGQGPKGRWRIDARRLVADGPSGAALVSVGDVATSSNMLFVRQPVAAAVLGLEIRFDRRAMTVTISTGRTAPRRLRREPKLPVERGREVAALPNVEVGADADTSGRLDLRFAGAGYIPAGRLSASVLASASDTLGRSLSSARLTAEARDLIPGSLLQAGDVHPFAGTLSAPAGGGLGLYLRPDLSNARSGRIPSGDAPAGWTAEISTPAGIAATVPVDASGRWTAPEDLALLPGQQVQVALRGPLGATLAPGEISYSAAAWLDDGRLLDLVQGRSGALAAFGELEAGVRWGSLRAGLAHRPFDEGSRRELSAGLSTGAGPVGLEADLGAADTGAVAGRVLLSAVAGGWSGMVDHRQASSGWAVDGMDPATSQTRVRAAGRLGDLALSGTFEHRSGSRDVVQVMAGRQVGPFFAQAVLEQGRYGQGLRFGRTLTWSTTMAGGPLLVRGRYVGRESFVDATWLGADDARLFAGAGKTTSGRFRAHLGGSQDIGGWRVSGQLERQSGSWGLRAGVSTSYGRDGLVRPARAGELSRLVVRAWMDMDADGRRDPGEPAVEDGVAVTVGNTAGNLRAGEASFPVPASNIRVSLAAEGITDGMVAAERPVRLVAVRPGSTTVVEIPVAPAGLIMGRVEGEGRLAGRRVVARGPAGRTLTAATDPDGEYLLDGAVLGPWTVEIDGLPPQRVVLTQDDPAPDLRHRLSPTAESSHITTESQPR
ncbi:hypothetical protein CHU95_03290 [Niveispirillum lacus]|uniref:Uncharacterized protein n=1 Tax=Niveispirillum lacus TaxID=1981099 RepID=A0A255Z5T0_9PROT|nr:hypothetical protein CHU95_03290 [Niveispirillum lacus]